MVWIHGGAFSIGSGSQPIYDGSVLARRGDTVVVTVNYRLGPLGFMRLADLTNGKIPATGNEGLLDQVAALAWVRDNIAEFGGDPSNVTIFGESAGGMSVGSLLAMESAKGLFHKAIPQSGACHTGAPADRASHVADRILTRLGLSGKDPDAIRALSAAQLLKGTYLPDGKTPDPELGFAYQPVVESKYLPRSPYEIVRDGASSNVAIMAGSTLDEWKLFAPMDPGAARLDRAGLLARRGRLTPEQAEKIASEYEQARAARGEPASPPELFCAIATDRIFRIPAIRLSEIQGRRNKSTYNYLFTWCSPAAGGLLGSCHALELGFVFGTNDQPGMAPFSGTGPAAERLATDMQDAWLAFARTGNPSCESVGKWASYDESRRATMIFGAKTGAEDAPRDQERKAWDGVPDFVLGAG
jgi:para-nitrobenzyl esterase